MIVAMVFCVSILLLCATFAFKWAVMFHGRAEKILAEAREREERAEKQEVLAYQVLEKANNVFREAEILKRAASEITQATQRTRVSS